MIAGSVFKCISQKSNILNYTKPNLLTLFTYYKEGRAAVGQALYCSESIRNATFVILLQKHTVDIKV